MSKAFTKEDDSGQATDVIKPAGVVLPSGAKNYMTPAGAARIREELAVLLKSSQKIQQQEELRIQYLRGRIDDLEILDPAHQKSEFVRFGATVQIEDEKGQKISYKIVGVDEANPKQREIRVLSR